MPIYSYQCNKCQEKFELLVGVTFDQSKLQCPECDSNDIKKTLSSFSVGTSDSGSSDCYTGTCSTGKCPSC